VSPASAWPGASPPKVPFEVPPGQPPVAQPPCGNVPSRSRHLQRGPWWDTPDGGTALVLLGGRPARP